MGSRNAGLRSTLVVFQFAVSVILLIGTMVIYRQMQFLLHSTTGFNKEQVIMIQGTDALREQTSTFREELMQESVVTAVSVSDFLPVNETKRNMNTYWKEGKTHEDAGFGAQTWLVDDDYLSTFGMKLAAGRNFSAAMPSDSDAVIINEAFAKQLGVANPLGEIITNGRNHKRIIGIVSNFNFETMKRQVGPLCMLLGNSSSMVSVKVKTADMHQTLTAIEKVWKHYVPHQMLRYRFLDESYAAMYADVQRTGTIFTGFAVLAVVIACLGLFALSAFMAEQRSKEVGIRKVLGASSANLFALLSGNFLKLVGIALLIAIPAGWLLMHQWLQDYTYRIALGPDVFVLAAITILLIAFVTICYQSIKAAIANPVRSLRSE